MQQRALDNAKIDFAWNSKVIDIIGSKEHGVTGVRLEDTVDGGERELPIQGIFLAIILGQVCFQIELIRVGGVDVYGP